MGHDKLPRVFVYSMGGSAEEMASAAPQSVRGHPLRARRRRKVSVVDAYKSFATVSEWRKLARTASYETASS